MTDEDIEPVVVPPAARVRRAYVCKNKDCAYRIFLRPGEPDKPVPKCPQHGPMDRQANQRYKRSRV